VSDNDASPLANTEVHYLVSDHVGAEFKIFVGHCPGLGGDPPKVLYVGDANGFFGGAVDAVRLMQLSAHLPPLLVVGIGYRMAGVDETVDIRTRDLTPTHSDAYAEIFPTRSVMGGAPQFLAFIRDELRPWVNAQYPVDGEGSMFFGHSLGGLFATYVLLTQPDTFARYGIGSPSLWWDRRVSFELEAAYAAEHDDLPAKVFFSIGEHEDHAGRQLEAIRLAEEERAITARWHIDMVADAERMVSQLQDRNYPKLEIASEVFADEFHITVPLLNLNRSLRYLFDAPR
jgi:predicted alpha/beta superfamily hydrolase